MRLSRPLSHMFHMSAQVGLYRLTIQHLFCTDDSLACSQLEVKGNILKIVIKAGGILDIVELHPLDGREVEIKRRDLRRGKTVTRAYRTPEGLLCIQ